MAKAKKLSIIIPCYNEKKTIRAIIKKVKAVDLGSTKKEIIIVDDCSTDGTTQILRDITKSDPEIKFIYRKENHGKGAALKLGIMESTGDVLIIQDADLEYDPSEYSKLLDPIERNQADVVYGSRFLGGDPHLTVYNANKYANKILTKISNVFSGLKITDMETCYKMMRGDLIRSFAKELTSERFGFEPEITAKLAKAKAYVYEVSISYYGRTKEEGKKIGLKDGVNAIWEIIYFNKFSQESKLIARKHKKPEGFKKIAMVSDTIYPWFKGGKEKRIHEITTRLANAGYDVNIYTMKWWDGPKSIIVDGVYLHGISKLHKVYVDGTKRSIKSGVLFGLSCFKLFFVKFDVIDVDHMPYLPLFSVWLVCKIRGKKLYATWHEVWSRKYWHEYLGVFGIIAYFIERVSTLLPDKIIVNSDFTNNRLKLRNPHRQGQLVTAYNGINLVEIESVKPSIHNTDIIYAGRLMGHKNIHTLIKAINELKKEFPDIKCTIIGDGPSANSLRELAEKLAIKDNVDFVGFLPSQKQVFARMKSAKVFVLPSEREGFGMAIIEANACGLPVITYNHPDNGATDIIKDGINGYLFKNLKELVEEIKVVLREPDVLTKDIIKDNVTQYDWESTVDSVINVYTEL